MTSTNTKKVLSALLALHVFSGCVLVEEDVNTRRTTTTTTTTTTSGPRGGGFIEEDVLVEEEVFYEEPWLFTPQTGSVQAEPVSWDPYYALSSSVYTMTFSDVASEWACDADPRDVSSGSVAILNVHGYLVDDEFAACPIGRYRVVPDCQLAEGEACMEVHQRDAFGDIFESQWAAHGVVDIAYIPARFFGEPHICEITTSVSGSLDMSFTFDMFFDSYDLSAEDPYVDPICTIGG
ncbi:MAG: hypothetical protein AAGI01_12090 [Myxococcota bacterium]